MESKKRQGRALNNRFIATLSLVKGLEQSLKQTYDCTIKQIKQNLGIST